MEEKKHFQEFTVEGVPTVVVKNISGSVTVAPGPDGLVSIAAIEKGSDDRTQVEIGQDPDGTIYARTRYSKASSVFGLFGDRPNKVHYTLSVPAQTDLVVKVVNAETDVRGVSGSVRLKSVNGEIRVSDLSGELHLETVNGRIAAEKLSGPAVVKTVSGDVKLTESDLPELDANSVSGTLDLQTPIGNGPYDLHTVSGNVRLRTGANPIGRVHFKSVSGSASVDGGRMRSTEHDTRPGSKRALYVLSNDGPDIHFHSVSGDLRLITNGDESPQAASPPPRPGRMEILDKLARGELSVDEAVSAMNG